MCILQNNKIRRRDRAIENIDQMLEIMAQCKICRLGLRDGEGVYIVPLNFAFSYQNNRLELYFHGAVKGKKITLIEQNPRAAFEMDCKHELVTAETACHYSYLYQSIMGNGDISLVKEENEKIAILQKFMGYYTEKSDWQFLPQELKKIHVIKLVVDEWSCKAH